MYDSDALLEAYCEIAKEVLADSPLRLQFVKDGGW